MIDLDRCDQMEYFTIEEAACYWSGFEPSIKDSLSKEDKEKIGSIERLLKEKIWLALTNDLDEYGNEDYDFPDDIDAHLKFKNFNDIDSGMTLHRNFFKKISNVLKYPDDKPLFLYHGAVYRKAFQPVEFFLTLLEKTIIRPADFSYKLVYFNTEDENELQERLSNIMYLPFEESILADCLSVEVVSKLFLEEIIRKSGHCNSYVYFDDSIRSGEELKERLEQIGIVEVENIFCIWQKSLFSEENRALVMTNWQQGQAELEQAQNEHEVNQAETPSPNSGSSFEIHEDYRLIIYNGGEYKLGKKLAAVVRIVHQAKLRGDPKVSHGYIREQLGWDKKVLLRDIYRRRQITYDGVLDSSEEGYLKLNID